jgi:class 3 adenylate cyclase
MKVTHSIYNFDKSLERIDGILNSSDNEYKKHKGIPSEGSLNFKNGFYVDITVVFIDIRGSKKLAEKHKRPVLAKIYRSYISEVIAVMKDNSTINDIFIEGDGVWAVFNTLNNTDVQSVFSTTLKISSLINALNKKMSKKGYSEIQVGIGIEDGESLYIKAGYKDSGVNEIVWIGKVVGESAKLSGYGCKEWNDKRIMISEKVYKKLIKYQQGFLEQNKNRDCYHGTFWWKDYE